MGWTNRPGGFRHDSSNRAGTYINGPCRSLGAVAGKHPQQKHQKTSSGNSRLRTCLGPPDSETETVYSRQNSAKSQKNPRRTTHFYQHHAAQHCAGIVNPLAFQTSLLTPIRKSLTKKRSTLSVRHGSPKTLLCNAPGLNHKPKSSLPRCGRVRRLLDLLHM